MTRLLMIFLAMAVAGPLFAQSGSQGASFTIGADTFASGRAVSHAEPGTDDLFIAGGSATLSAPITGTFHGMGRHVAIDAAVGGDIYAGGMSITLSAPVNGDATMLGETVTVDAPVGDDLRAAAATLWVNAPVAGYGWLSGEKVILNSRIDGDVSLQAADIEFGPDAKIGGQLTLYEGEDDAIVVPSSVIDEARITRKPFEDWEGINGGKIGALSWRSMVRSFLTGVLVIAAVAGLIAAVAPEHLARMRNRLLAAPFRTLWFGFLTQSVLVGSAILFAMTVIGLLIAPASIVIALALGFFGYVIGAYSLGVGLILMAGREEPDGLVERVVAAFIGALVAGVIGLIPFFGWIFVLALTLAGVGAISVRLFRPAFFVDA
ncbi:MAG TPA: hypothetical protein ENJ26_00010 [Rhodobacteraceae bacterium]|nr:hypothetical protein [Paracoccaceae bacterium]